MICTRQEGSDSLQRAQSTITISCIQRLESESKFNPTREHKVLNRHEIEKPRRHKEDGASFPKQIQYMVSRILLQNLTLEEEGRRTEREGERRREQSREGTVLCLVRPPGRESQRSCPACLLSPPCCCPASLSSSPSLPLKTRIPLSAKIKLEGP